MYWYSSCAGLLEDVGFEAAVPFVSFDAGFGVSAGVITGSRAGEDIIGQVREAPVLSCWNYDFAEYLEVAERVRRDCATGPCRPPTRGLEQISLTAFALTAKHTTTQRAIMAEEEAAHHLLNVLEERALNVDLDKILLGFEDEQIKHEAALWVQEHLYEDTLLTKEELELQVSNW